MTRSLDAPVTDWRPSGQLVGYADLPIRLLILERMQDLAQLAAPTPTESVELELLIAWLALSDPAQELRDQQALERAANRLHISPLGDDAFLMPAYVIAGPAWQNLIKIAGNELPAPARPVFQPTGMSADDDRYDAWQEHRASKAREWFSHMLTVMDQLEDRNWLYPLDLHDQLVRTGLYRQLRRDIGRNLFDSPFSVGASLYLEPMPGLSFGRNGKIIEILDSLTQATVDALNAFRDIVWTKGDPVDKVVKAKAADRLFFFGGMLKGYIVAGSVTAAGGLLMGGALASLPDKWEAVQRILEGARAIMLEHQDVFGIGSDWVHHGTPLHSQIAETSLEDAFAAMNRRIAECAPLGNAL